MAVARYANERALAANSAGRLGVAFALFNQAHGMVPRRPAYCISAANMALKLGDAAVALDLYDEALNMVLVPEQQAMVEAKSMSARLQLEG